MKTLKKLMGIVLTLAFIASVSMVPAGAATTYTPVEGTSATFNKYLIMDAGDNVPNVKFSFTVTQGEAISADTSDNPVMQVLPGVGTPTIADVTFEPSDGTVTAQGSNIDVARTQEDRTGTAGTDTVQLDSGEKYATKQATVSFSGITFPEPGIYRYIITETADADHAAAGIIHDTDADRVLDVYVTDDGSGTLVVSGYVLHTDVSNVAIGESMGSDDVAAAGDALDDKTDGFTNEYTTKDLKISKEVSGNQASRDKWFEITVKATNVADTDSFVVSLVGDTDDSTNDGNADATSGTTAATRSTNQNKANPTTVTGADLKSQNGVKFYLQHGQNVVIRGLPLNANYTVSEDAEDYLSAVMSGKMNTGVIGTVAGNKKMAEAGFTNTRNGVIPTGLIKVLAPAVGVIVLAVVGLGIVMASKRREEEEAE